MTPLLSWLLVVALLLLVGVPTVRAAHAAATSLPICPECAAGKHPNCNGTAWDNEADRLTECSCSHEQAHLGAPAPTTERNHP